MRTCQVTSVDGHTMTVQLDDDAAGRLGLIPEDAVGPDVEEHATAPAAAVEKAVVRIKRRR